MSQLIVLYHTTPARKLPSILRAGILPELARGARKESWLHTRCRLDWALDHVARRHGCGAVVSLRVLVPRSSLTRRKRGVWTTSAVIAPGAVQAVNVVGLVGRAAA